MCVSNFSTTIYCCTLQPFDMMQRAPDRNESRSFQRLRCLAMLRPWFCVAIAMPPSWHWHTVVTGFPFPPGYDGCNMVVSLVFVAAAVEDLDTCTTCMGGGVKKCESGWVYSCVQSGMLNLPEDQRMHNMFDLFNPKKHKFSLNKAWLNSLFFGTLGGG